MLALNFSEVCGHTLCLAELTARTELVMLLLQQGLPPGPPASPALTQTQHPTLSAILIPS